jgi:hypothetical protein
VTRRAVSGPGRLTYSGGQLPVLAARAAFAFIGAALTVIDYAPSGWWAVGFALSVAAPLLPRYLLGWLLIAYLAAGRLAYHPALSWRFLVVLAGVHLLHVLAMMNLQLPRRGTVQASVFLAPLRRFVAIQVPAQLCAVMALAVLAPTRSGHRPLTISVVAAAGAAALIGVAVLVSAPRRAQRR